LRKDTIFIGFYDRYFIGCSDHRVKIEKPKKLTEEAEEVEKNEEETK
jgi:hypothetical protein